MRNADERTNLRAADTMNLKREIVKANECNENEMFPYIFIDKTNYARVTGLKVFVDIFSKYRKVIMKSNLFYLIGEKDFESRFHKVDENVANENTSSRIRDSTSKSEEPTECSRSSAGTTSARTTSVGTTSVDTISDGFNPSPTAGDATREPGNRYGRRELKRRIKQAVYRHKQRPIV